MAVTATGSFPWLRMAALLAVSTLPSTTEIGSAAGAVFVAQVEALGPLPPLEMAETALFSALPRELTYPGITPVLWRRAREYFPGVGEG